MGLGDATFDLRDDMEINGFFLEEEDKDKENWLKKMMIYNMNSLFSYVWNQVLHHIEIKFTIKTFAW